MANNSLSIALAAAIAIVGCVSAAAAATATGCYPIHVVGRTYAIGESASASVTTITLMSSVVCSPPGVDDCPESGLKTEGGFSTSDMYNFQCISDDDLCSNDKYAPGSINSELAWKRETTPCASVSCIYVYIIHILSFYAVTRDQYIFPNVGQY